jgi:hypothetical protein
VELRLGTFNEVRSLNGLISSEIDNARNVLVPGPCMSRKKRLSRETFSPHFKTVHVLVSLELIYIVHSR